VQREGIYVKEKTQCIGPRSKQVPTDWYNDTLTVVKMQKTLSYVILRSNMLHRILCVRVYVFGWCVCVVCVFECVGVVCVCLWGVCVYRVCVMSVCEVCVIVCGMSVCCVCVV